MMESKKDIAVTFLQLASSGNVRQVYRKYAHPLFIHHNPYFICTSRPNIPKSLARLDDRFTGALAKTACLPVNG
jgi:hypothetical protein